MTKLTGGSAFPIQPTVQTAEELRVYGDPGMTLRDWFAGQALCGAIANSEGVHSGAEPTLSSLQGETGGAPWFAKLSYALADAMLAERAKEATS